MTDHPSDRTPPWAVEVRTIPGRPPTHPVRIGDAERDDALTRLGEHFAAGRLDRDELDERTEAALAARFDRDLAALFDDLPDRPRDVVARRARPSVPTGVPPVVLLLVPLVVLAVVASIAMHGLVLVAPLFWLLVLSGMGRRHRYR